MPTTKEKRSPGGGKLKKPKIALPDVGEELILDNKPGLAAAINRLRQAEIKAAQDYQLAISTGDTDLIVRKQTDWRNLIEQLRKVEVSNPDVEKAHSRTVNVEEVEKDIARMCNSFRVALEALPRSLPQKLLGQEEVEIQQTLMEAIGETLEKLHSKKWASD